MANFSHKKKSCFSSNAHSCLLLPERRPPQFRHSGKLFLLNWKFQSSFQNKKWFKEESCFSTLEIQKGIQLVGSDLGHVLSVLCHCHSQVSASVAAGSPGCAGGAPSRVVLETLSVVDTHLRQKEMPKNFCKTHCVAFLQQENKCVVLFCQHTAFRFLKQELPSCRRRTTRHSSPNKDCNCTGSRSRRRCSIWAQQERSRPWKNSSLPFWKFAFLFDHIDWNWHTWRSRSRHPGASSRRFLHPSHTCRVRMELRTPDQHKARHGQRATERVSLWSGRCPAQSQDLWPQPFLTKEQKSHDIWSLSSYNRNCPLLTQLGNL